MALSPGQRAAVFEKLKKRGIVHPMNQVPPTPHPKLANPMVPPMAKIPTAPTNMDQVNPNFIGQGRAQRFKKLKSVMGI